MKLPLHCLLASIIALLGLPSCSQEISPDELPRPLPTPASSPAHPEEALWVRHHESALKILAIGNSFTDNGTNWLPRLINDCDGDSICIAKLTRSGCSLQQHWENHLNDREDYTLSYSDRGRWQASETKTIDGALYLMDWDIIILQQVSNDAGRWPTFQPWLDFMKDLCLAANPSARLGWQYTWAYTPGSSHPCFGYYDNDSEKMYAAIMEAQDRASEGMDFKIMSAPLVRKLREAYPEVSNQFSADGYHIIDDLALLALSMLWHDTLITPFNGASAIAKPSYPAGVDPERFERALAILREMLPPPGDDDNSVPEIRI